MARASVVPLAPGSGGVSPTLGRRPAPLSLSCGPVNEGGAYGAGTLVRQTHAPRCR